MRIATALAATLLFVCLPLAAQKVGEPLPAWTPGTLDIHQINTGKGNSALFVLPDGTSLLVDAGDGSHNVMSDKKVGITVYGVVDYGSYWYPGGLDLDVIPQ